MWPVKEIFRLPLIACLFSCSLFSQNITLDTPKIILKDVGFSLVFSGEFDGNTAYLLSINRQNFKPDQITSEKLFFDKIYQLYYKPKIFFPKEFISKLLF